LNIVCLEQFGCDITTLEGTLVGDRHHQSKEGCFHTVWAKLSGQYQEWHTVQSVNDSRESSTGEQKDDIWAPSYVQSVKENIIRKVYDRKKDLGSKKDSSERDVSEPFVVNDDTESQEHVRSKIDPTDDSWSDGIKRVRKWSHSSVKSQLGQVGNEDPDGNSENQEWGSEQCNKELDNLLGKGFDTRNKVSLGFRQKEHKDQETDRPEKTDGVEEI
jgi:hypothetical protein